MGAPTIVSHWFSFARSPPGGLARSGLWLVRSILMACPPLTWTVLQIEGALSRLYVVPAYVSDRTDVTSIAQVPALTGLALATVLTWKAPAQLAPPVFHIWLARMVLSDVDGSSGGFSSLLTNPPALV